MEIESTLEHIEQHLHRIADALDADRPAPGYHRPLSEYPGFNWPDITARELTHDDNGATRVEWNRHTFTRRSNAKYGPGVWFSRGAGRDDDGNVQYDRLITFSPHGAVEELPAKVARALTAGTPTPAIHQEQPPEAQPPQESSQLDRYFPRDREQPATPAETDRKRFFRLLPVAIAAGLDPADANTLTAITKRTGYTEPLATLEQHIERLEAATTA